MPLPSSRLLPPLIHLTLAHSLTDMRLFRSLIPSFSCFVLASTALKVSVQSSTCESVTWDVALEEAEMGSCKHVSGLPRWDASPVALVLTLPVLQIELAVLDADDRQLLPQRRVACARGGDVSNLHASRVARPKLTLPSI